MSDPADVRLVLGIDGGGSKTTAWLASVTGGEPPTVLGRTTTGGSNPRALGFERAYEMVGGAVAGAFANAGLPRRAVDGACLALAGAGRESERAELLQWCRRAGIAERIYIATDAEPVLAAGTPENWGVALIAGTGSFCRGKTRDGREARAGGWGYLFGDEGSGYALAVNGLRAAAQAVDGRGPETVLESRFLNRLNLENPSELIEAIYGGGMTRTELAGLAEVVMETAEAGDEVAVRVVRDAASHLAAHVRAVVKRLDMDPRHIPLALAGGLLAHAGWLRDGLIEELENSGHVPAPVNIVPEPVEGAVLLAVRLLDGAQ